jgi:hypothetical protein
MAYFLNLSMESFKMKAMKTLILKQGGFLMMIGLFLISLNGSSQDNKLSKEEQREARKAERLLNFQALDTLIENKSFVLEADYLENQYGNRIPVLSNLNFIMLDSLKAVLQTGSNFRTGTNGVGGATAEGRIDGLKIVKNQKNLSYFLRFSVSTEIGMYDVSMTIFSDNRATATITGLTRGKLVYDGRIQALYNSSVYKGRNTI